MLLLIKQIKSGEKRHVRLAGGMVLKVVATNALGADGLMSKNNLDLED